MPSPIATAFVAIKPDASGFGPEVKREVESPLRSVAKGIAGTVSAAAGFRVLGRFAADAFASFREASVVAGQTEARLKQTGAVAGVTAEDISGLASSVQAYSGLSDEAVANGANLLLTFTKIRNEVGKGNDIFDQAVTIAADMATVLGTDVQQSAIQVGKALQDPVRGVTALRRAGVSFTEQQQEQIKALAESGQLLEAQKLVLSELTVQFGGAAKALGDADPTLRAAAAFDDLKESVGAVIAVGLEPLASGATAVLQGFQALPGPIKTAVVVVGGLGAAAALATLGVASLRRAMQELGITMSVGLGPISAVFAAISVAVTIASSFAGANREMQEGIDKTSEALRDGSLTLEEYNRQIADAQRLGGHAGRVFEDMLAKGLQEARSALRDQLRELERTPGALKENQVALIEAAIASDDLAGAQRLLGIAQDKAAGAAAAEAEAQLNAADAKRENYRASLQLAGGFLGVQAAAFDARDAQRGLNEAQAKVRKLAAEGAKGTKAYRDALRESRTAQVDSLEAQLGLAQSVADYIQELKDSGQSQGDVNALIESFGKRAGLTKDQVDTLRSNVRDLIGAYRDVPKDVRTHVRAVGIEEARRAVDGYVGALNSVPGTTTTLPGGSGGGRGNNPNNLPGPTRTEVVVEMDGERIARSAEGHRQRVRFKNGGRRRG